MLNLKSHVICMVWCGLFFLTACGNSNSEADKKVEIKPAPKLSNDATAYANAAWKLINELDPLVYQNQLTDIDQKIRKPLRQLSTDWRIHVKMTDSVTEGKYALCRKALTSLDIWARALQEGKDVLSKKTDYERDKAQCKDAIDHPALGNTKANSNLF